MNASPEPRPAQELTTGRRRSRLPVVALAASLAFLVGIPAAWALTRPEANVGTTLGSATAPAQLSQSQGESTPAEQEARARARELAKGAAPAAAPLPAPVSVSVPALGVTATVVPTGVQDDGQMEIPPGRGEAGWYRYGPAVGDDRGSAVIAAHVATPEGKGAFFPLRDSVVGQRVIVTLADGSTREYQVSGRSQWNKAELPVAEVFRPSGDHRLTLVTCGGAFDRDNGRYTDNVVVTAVPVGVK